MGFARPEFLWALPLVLVPVIIHLLSRLRYRRVVFPATRFLLESQRRHKIRVLLEDWLLLALRMVLVAAIILAFAQPRTQSAHLWASLTDEGEHFVFVLDDTLSMQSRRGPLETDSCWECAKSAAGALLKELVDRQGRARISVVRASQLAGESTRMDLIAESLSTDTLSRIVGMVETFPPSHSAAPLSQTMARTIEVFDLAREKAIFVLFSDFRAIDCHPAPLWTKISGRLQQTRCPVRLIPCALRYGAANVAITSLEPTGGIQAAHVPLGLRVSVRNFSDQALRDLTVELFCEDEPLPPIVLPEVPPGTDVHRELFVIPPYAGDVRVEVRLPSDMLEADNRRYLVVPVAESVKVLVVDADPAAGGGQFVELALSPGGGVHTGIACRRTTADGLLGEAIETFDLVCLVGAGLANRSLAERLKNFVAEGGGLLVWAGDRTDLATFVELFCQGPEAIFPVRLRALEEATPSVFLSTGNVEFVDHPGLRGLAALKGPIVDSIFVTRFWGLELLEHVDRANADEAGSPALGQVFLRLKTGQPLGVTFTFGRGKAALVATTADPSWNNWARVSPTFVVALLELVGYLARREAPIFSPMAGQMAEVKLPGGKTPAEVRYHLPGSDADEKRASAPVAVTSAGTLFTLAPGFGSIEWEEEGGKKSLRHFAANVDCRESDLRPATADEILRLFAGCDVAVIDPEAIAQVELSPTAMDVVPLFMAFALLVAALETATVFVTLRQRSGPKEGK